MIYQLTVTENQLRLLKTACEEYLRLRLGQMNMLADDLSFMQYRDEKEFDVRIAKRSACEDLLTSAYNLVVDRYTLGKTENMLIAQDMYDVIKHQIWLDEDKGDFWTVDSNPPIKSSNEPLAAIRRIKK